MSSAICFNLDQSKILSSGNGLTLFANLPYEITSGDGWRKTYKECVKVGWCADFVCQYVPQIDVVGSNLVTKLKSMAENLP